MGLKYILKDGLNPFLEALLKSAHFQKKEDLIKWLGLTRDLCTDSADLSVSITDKSVAFCKGERPLAIWG